MFEGELYPTVEHAFQAAKALDLQVRAGIREAGHPAAAKQMGRRVDLRKDWEQVKYGIMLDLLRDKFRDPELRTLLMATGDAQLIEGNTWNDKIWGAVLVKGEWIGKNNLGKLLMQVRTECRMA